MIEDPNQKNVPKPDPFKQGSDEQKGMLNTPLDEQQYEKEPEPPLDRDSVN